MNKTVTVEQCDHDMAGRATNAWRDDLTTEATKEEYIAAMARHEATLQSQEQIKLLREALEEIVEPVKFMKQRADAEGKRLSGMAWSIAREASYLQEIARRVLEATNG